jgi:Na+-translocating ferredoxin:NAD+ oxidoreductase RnfC subunit
MIVDRIRALSYLAYRALVAHPLKRLRWRGTGRERFLAAYQGEGLLPTRLEDREIRQAASACISCGLCENGYSPGGDPVALHGMGIHAAFRLYTRSDMVLSRAGDDLAACPVSGTFEAVCPTGVPISRILLQLKHREANQPA